MNKSGILYGIVGLCAGLAVGFSAANYMNRNGAANPLDVSDAPPFSQTQNQDATAPNGMLADVQVVLDKAAKEPENYEAQIEAGEMYSQIQRFDKALEFFQNAQKIKPEDFNANVKLGAAYFNLKKYEDAEKIYAKAIEINPKDVDLRSDYGLTFYLREPEELDKAIAEYKKALEIDPNHELSLQNLSAALNQKGEKEELAKVIEKLKEINPKNPAIEKFGS